jgi:hypothetical protein
MPGLLDPHRYSSNYEDEDDSENDNDPQDGDTNVPSAPGIIMAGSRNKVWADTTMRWENDNFCDSCQVVTALANCGKSPLKIVHKEMLPSKCVMVDVVLNLNK